MELGQLHDPGNRKRDDGTWKSQSYWGGLEDDMIRLSSDFSTRAGRFPGQVLAKKDQIAKGTFDVFWGALKDNKGAVRQNAGEKMSDQAMLTMDWFVEGVIGSVK